MASLSATPREGHESRIRSSRIVALNGRQFTSPQRRVEMPPGNNQVTLRFDWPRQGMTHANLRFRAQANRRYFVSYDPFPLGQDFDPGDYARWVPNDLSAIFVLPVVAPVFAGGRIAHRAEQNNLSTHYIDILVISENQAEGVVRKQRVYPDSRPAS
jgi:hypothetical protein